MTRRCVTCGFECPYLEAAAHFYKRKRGHFESRCKECSKARAVAWIAANPERKRAYDAARREAINADPERRAVVRDSQREHNRRVRGSDPARYRATFAPSGTVPADAIREAVERAGVGASAIGRSAGLAEGTVRRALEARTMQLRTAKKILEAVGVAPVEVGL